MRANKGLLFRGFLAFSLILTGLVALAQGEPSGSAAEIVVEEADVTLMLELSGSHELAQAASEVSPRVVVDHAAISWSTEVVSSPELVEMTKGTAPRIVVDHAASSSLGTLSGSKELEQVAHQVAPRIVIANAATSSLWQDLAGSPELNEAAYEVSPRILIEHAEAGTLQAPSAPQFQSPLEPEPPHPARSPLSWVVIGLAAGLLVAFLIWRLTG